MVKKRTIQQKLEDESKGVLLTLFKDWIVNALNKDFGFDFEVRLTSPIDEKSQEVSEISFYVQNKSSIKSKDEKAVEDLSVDDWALYLGQRIPVLIVKYDASNKKFYWEIAQDYLWDVIEKEDPDWRRQKTKRIALTKEISQLNEIKNAIIISQKRITRHHSLNLGIGEGIKISGQDLSELTRIKEKSLDEYKALSLRESYYARKKGDRETSFKSLMDVYNSPKNDETKIRAIIGIIFELNIADLAQNKQIVTLANEAIRLSEDLKIQYLKDYVTVLRNQAILFIIIKKVSEVQLGLKVQQLQGEQLFSFFYNQELVKLNEFHQRIIHEINDCLLSLLSDKQVYYFLASLPILIDISTVQIMQFAVFDRRIIEEEKEGRRRFVEQCEYALANVSEIDLKKMLLRSLANYYYWTLENEKAVRYMSKAIELGEIDRDKSFVEGNSGLFEQMKSKPNPYEAPGVKPVEEMTVKEYQDITKELVKAQGIILENKDDVTNAISIALRDMNPEAYFRHCENLHISYLNTSVVGASIGLPSMGTKFVWCRYCKSSIAGLDLEGTFNSFKQQNCQSCKFQKPRSRNWVCYVRWVKEQESDPEFRTVLTNFRKNWFGKYRVRMWVQFLGGSQVRILPAAPSTLDYLVGF